LFFELLNLTRVEYLKNTGESWEEVVLEIKARILQETRLTCSIGIAPNKILAKLGTEVNKPNGYYRIPPTRCEANERA
jgi:nucleotidyltransferase/DNA polymerase involved in DNA repair